MNACLVLSVLSTLTQDPDSGNPAAHNRPQGQPDLHRALLGLHMAL